MVQAYDNMVKEVQSLPKLNLLDCSDTAGPLHLYCDSSSHTYGAVLAQSIYHTDAEGRISEKKYPLGFFSRTHKGSEKNYTISESEINSVVAALDFWGPYLRTSKALHCYTDNSVCYWTAKLLEQGKMTTSKIINKLLLSLQQTYCDFVMHYSKSKANVLSLIHI